MSIHPRYLACLIVACAAAEVGPTVLARDQPPSAVLSLHASGTDNLVAQLSETFLRQTLDERQGPLTDHYVEYLDFSRFPRLSYEDAVLRYLYSKYEGRGLDLVIANGDAVLSFVTRHRNHPLFAGVPVVFSASAAPPFVGVPNATGVIGRLTLRESLDLALRILPDTKRVAVVSGASPFSGNFEAIARDEFKDLEGRVEVTYLSGLPVSTLLERVAALPPRSILFFTMLFEDGEGRALSVSDTARRVIAASSAPVFTLFSMGMDEGIVGGRMLSTRVLAERMADVAARVLRGENPHSIPVAEVDWSVTEFDWRQLERWQIREAALPSGSTILFRRPGVWELYRVQIVAGLLLVLLETGLIAGLLVQRAQRKHAEQQFRAAIEASPVGMVMVDRLGKIALLNAQVGRMFGYTHDELIGQPVEMLIPGPSSAGRGQLWDDLQRDSSTRLMSPGREVRGLRKDGGELFVEIALNPIRTAQGEFVLGSIVDVSERKVADLEREFLMHELQKLSGRLIASQDVERARIARDLHDDTSQQLASLSIGLSAVKRRIGSLVADDGLQDDVSLLQRRTMALAEGVRNLSHDLHPGVLQHIGLPAALTTFCDDLRRQHSFTLALDIEGKFDALTMDRALCLYRVAQGALRNVAQHADAHEVEVTLRSVDERVTLTIADDGVGFDPTRTGHSGRGLGLVSMRERIRSIGGTIAVVSEVGAGTKITVQIPVQSPAFA